MKKTPNVRFSGLTFVDSTEMVVFLSGVPKIAFTHLTHTVSFNREGLVPRLTWGKYFERNGEWKIPLNLQAHHAFVDGEDTGIYFKTLQKFLDE